MLTKILPFIFLLLIAGCSDNYDIKESEGKLYRINKRTGDVDLINGKSLIRIQNSALQTKKDSTLFGLDSITDGYRYISGPPEDSTSWRELDTSEWTKIGRYKVKENKTKPWTRCGFRKKYNY
jgi:hypothetical protein